MMSGFALALPMVYTIDVVRQLAVDPSIPASFMEFTYSSGPGSGWTLLALTGPAFIISPGLIQKSWGGANERAVRTGVLLNAAVLLVFAFVPVLFGIAARGTIPAITDPNAVLPTVLTRQLPPWLGAIALSAVFSTEVDTCDAILFMISTSASKDLYKRFLRPEASDAMLLRVARLTAFAGGMIGVLLAIVLQTVIGAVTIFYSLLVVTLFVPIIGGIYVPRARSREALAAICAGVLTLFIVRFTLMPFYPWLDPTVSGLIAATIAFASTLALRRGPFGSARRA
jgi:SSS family solute:Na+ symporter